MKLLNEPSFSEVIQRAWELYRQNLKQLFIIALVIAVLYQLFIMLMHHSGMVNLIYQMMNQKAEGKAVSSLANQVTATMHLVLFLGMAFYLILMPLVVGIFQNIVDDSWQGRHRTLSQHLSFVLPRLPTLAVATFLVYLLIMVAVIISSMLFGLLGLLIYAALIIYVPLILYDRKNMFTSISESFRLTIVSFGKTCAIAVICYLLLNLPSTAAWIVQNMLETNNSLAFGIDEVISIFLAAFIWPLVAVLKLALYYALKAKAYNLKAHKVNKIN